RAQMEDNFHVSERFAKQRQDRASLGPGLFYRFRYGSGLELICVDTSEDSDNPDYHRFFQAPDHKQWLEEALAEADPTWRIPFSHHPVYCAGPSHDNDAEMLETLLPLYERGGVRLALAGHEHNFQVSEVDGRTFVVSGAAGQLREETPKWFEEAHTTAWAAQAHLLLVEIDGAEARLTPISGLLPDGSLHVMTRSIRGTRSCGRRSSYGSRGEPSQGGLRPRRGAAPSPAPGRHASVVEDERPRAALGRGS
ncbi:MAG TPA: metallophosphoesterase, partial [Jiangellaceae bacterium]|nr:metallophosphoesterase [Jiangellaceae bacterium]